MIAIFGASGYIGSNLRALLNKKGVKFICPATSKNKDCIFIKDFSLNSIKKLIIKYRVKMIINLHAQTNIKNSYEDLGYDFLHNVLPTLSILQSIKEIDKSISYIFIGTATQIGYTNIEKSINLNYKPNPSTVFDLNKQYCEDLIKLYKENYSLKAFTLRLSNVFGPGKVTNNDRGVINKMINDAIKLNKVSLYGSGKFIRDFIYIDDVTNAIYLAIKFSSELSVNYFYYISTNKAVSFIDFATALKAIIKKKMGKSIKIELQSWPKNISKINKRSFVGNNKSFVKITSWKPEKNLVKNISKYINSQF